MNSRSLFAIALVAVLSVFLPQAGAQAPTYVPIQGYLTDSAGLPTDGKVTLVFKLYSDVSGGTVLFSETKPAVKVEQGYFSVYLGDDSATAAGEQLMAVFRDRTLVWVGIQVGGDPDELSPRLQFATAPYAAFAQYCGDASTLGGRNQSDFVKAGELKAGTGLVLSGATFSADPAYVAPQAQAAVNARTTDQITAWQQYTTSVVNYPGNTAVPNLVNRAIWRRVGDSIEVSIESRLTADAASGDTAWMWELPPGLSADRAKTTLNLGTALGATLLLGWPTCSVFLTAYDQRVGIYCDKAKNTVGNGGSPSLKSGDQFSLKFTVPVTGLP